MKAIKDGYINFRIAIPAEYEEVFSHFYFAKNTSAQAMNQILLPSYQTILIFSFGVTPSLQSRRNTVLNIEKCFVIGPVKQAIKYTLPPGAEILTANFKDDAFHRFFGHANVAEHLPMDPDELLSEDCFLSLWHKLAPITCANDRVAAILQFSEPYLQHRNKIASQLASFEDESLDPIKSVALKNLQTARNTQINHKKHFGYSAKEIARYKRFLKAIERLQQLDPGTLKINWFEIVSECGYYDQSQLIHDFKHYINMTPAKYIKFQQDICNPVS